MLGTAKSVAQGLLNPDNKSASVSSDGKSWGLMQVTVPTANDFEDNITFKELNDPDTAVRIAAKFVASLMKTFAKNKGDSDYLKKIIMSYNQGAGNTLKGKTYAAPYWDKFQTYFDVINQRQPED
jgi:soluble lytic murein transglycosylase-like protein